MGAAGRSAGTTPTRPGGDGGPQWVYVARRRGRRTDPGGWRTGRCGGRRTGRCGGPRTAGSGLGTAGRGRRTVRGGRRPLQPRPAGRPSDHHFGVVCVFPRRTDVRRAMARTDFGARVAAVRAADGAAGDGPVPRHFPAVGRPARRQVDGAGAH